jgi:N-acetylmuramoyl-L-alanine amidase
MKAAARLTALALACLLGLPAYASAAGGRPDRTLYQKAEQERTALNRSEARMSKRREWERVIGRYREVVSRYPKSAYSDNALASIGDMYRAMADRFKDGRYRREAVQAYRSVVSEYPSSSLGESALFNVVQMMRASRSRHEIGEAARAYLEAFPDSKRASVVKAAIRRSAPAQAAELPSPPPPGLAQVFSLRFWSGETSTRVVLELERKVALQHERLSGPDRLYIDLEGARLHPNLKQQPVLPVGDGLLEAIRVSPNRPQVVRVVLDFKNVKDHTVFYLEDPPRLVIDVRGAETTRVPNTLVAAGPGPSATAPETMAVPAAARPEWTSAEISPLPRTSPSARPREVPPARTSAVAVAEARTPTALPTSNPGTPFPVSTDTPPRTRSLPQVASAEVPTAALPAAPQPNRATSAYSIARQLGLGARRIVIDAGHGGHDPGTIGRAGLQEKDLVLDVALRLRRLVQDELRAEVVMTRDTDVFIPLEERTGIANSKGADLFLSIHANSSRSPKAAGVETYFLNFAADRHAEEVAARENAISAATLKDLQGLVKAIALNGKIDESREFATCVHEAMFKGLNAVNSRVNDRGVRTAPFYVLIGANMPSVLAEIAFVSHPEEEKLLRKGDYRDRIARTLVTGVKAYLESLNRAPIPQLTSASSASTLAESRRVLPLPGKTRRDGRRPRR